MEKGLPGDGLSHTTSTVPPKNLSPLLKSFAIFMFFVMAGVLFFSLVPAEKKNIVEALYVSIMTLSTVGFGDYAAITGGGRVFSTFWMIFGVAAMGNLVCTFADSVLGIKKTRRMVELSSALLDVMDMNGDGVVSRLEFLTYVLQIEGLVSDDILKEIDGNFDALDKDGSDELSTADVEAFFNQRAGVNFHLHSAAT